MLKFLAGCLIGTVLAASATASDSVAHFEAALGFVPQKTTRVVPSLGATLLYIKTVALRDNVYAIYVKKLD